MRQEFIIVAVPLAMAAFDVLTGYAAAAKNGELNSSVMSDGLWGKLGEVFSIVASFAAEYCVSLYGNQFIHVTIDVPITTGVCAYIALYELTSIVENIGKLNKDIAKWLVNTFGFEPYKVGLDEGDAND